MITEEEKWIKHFSELYEDEKTVRPEADDEQIEETTDLEKLPENEEMVQRDNHVMPCNVIHGTSNSGCIKQQQLEFIAAKRKHYLRKVPHASTNYMGELKRLKGAYGAWFSGTGTRPPLSLLYYLMLV
ncbi:hypothetical protein ILUMI_09777 [Ignelater luminosus]|uniref:Uncharacterized protein n=1 Tax=Ignelater luminosus TaxID=2038154 RepID=A0A8K0D394_IGNLU|nr:hypothetical protein ILUMI_09777 [Ignelater luminosus]